MMHRSSLKLSTDSDNEDGAPFSLLPTNSDCSITKVLAMDCEMVEVGAYKKSALARVSIVNYFGNVVYDKYVRPTEPITDYRTRFSGVRPGNMRTAEDFRTAQKEVSKILKNRTVVGHALHHDLQALLLRHPQIDTRDTQNYKLFRSDQDRPQSLKYLAKLHLGAEIQEGEHDSVDDARAALGLYRLDQQAWEKDVKSNQRRIMPNKAKRATYSRRSSAFT